MVSYKYFEYFYEKNQGKKKFTLIFRNLLKSTKKIMWMFPQEFLLFVKTFPHKILGQESPRKVNRTNTTKGFDTVKIKKMREKLLKYEENCCI